MTSSGIQVDVPAAARGYATTCRYLLAFLKTTLEHDQQARQKLAAAQLDPGELVVEYKEPVAR